ncbi:Hsp33 family molecular chaperone HslO [Coralloluteibacterium thermophilus]|uniref:Hsp33 family molecular chaperone HslO n=1 Tax=Coralloluteibacterium thermophilum TaxID=2707049 RepID=A0ABV9NL02_9GAMM
MNHAPSSPADPDRLHRFLLDKAGVRGILVRLDDAWTRIRETSDYPGPVAERLGEACVAAALFTGHAKVDGRLSIQLKGTGPLRTLFAECTAEGTLRGIAHHADTVPDPLTPRQLGQGSLMAITIENHPPGARDVQRYQGLVDLDADSFMEAFEGYFDRSEQLPTRLRLVSSDGRAAGLMLQQLPGDVGDADGWTRAQALFETLTDEELLRLPAHDLLWRLFNEEDVRVLGDSALRFRCSCSRERVAAMLEGLGREEARAATATGIAEVRCEFCGTAYTFTPDEIEALFDRPLTGEGSDRLQ